VKEVAGDGEEYTVVFTINDKDVSSKWVREYGNWRIRTFGTVAAGDQSLVAKKESQREAAKRLRLDSGIHLEAGYASLFDKSPAAVYASAEFFRLMGVKLYIASGFWSIGGFVGYRWDIPSGNFGFMPYARVGFEYQNDREYEDYKDYKNRIEFGHAMTPAPVSLTGQAGLKVTSSFVPGLFLGTAFQVNINMHEIIGDYKNPMKMGLAVTTGYAF